MKIYQLGGYTVKAKHSSEFPSVLGSLLDCTSTDCFLVSYTIVAKAICRKDNQFLP